MPLRRFLLPRRCDSIRSGIQSATIRVFKNWRAEKAPLPEKSIAVLPFENLSKDEENAFFAGGVQDEILADLTKVPI